MCNYDRGGGGGSLIIAFTEMFVANLHSWPDHISVNGFMEIKAQSISRCKDTVGRVCIQAYFICIYFEQK